MKFLILASVAIFTVLVCRASEGGEVAKLSIGKGNSDWEIVTETGCPDTVRYAAQDLQQYIRRVTGLEIPIHAQGAKSSSYTIYLGDSSFAREKGVKAGNLPPDGFRIISGDKWILIAGNDYSGPTLAGFENPSRPGESSDYATGLSAFGNNGTWHGVNEFLRRYAGVRWYMPGPLGEVVPEREEISISAVDMEKFPQFEHRHIHFCNFNNSSENAFWYKHLGYGSPFPPEIIHSFGRYFIKYKDTNPEYFAIIDGQRDFTNLSTVQGSGNLNLSNPGLISQAVKDAIKFFDENPNLKIYTLSPNDGMKKISEDEESQSQIDLSMGDEGKFSNYIWGFINKVAAEVGKTHPDRLIGCLAYEHYLLPPSNIDKLHPNVAVTICKSRRNLGDKAYVERLEKLMAAWRKKVSVIYTWEYYGDVVLNPGWRGYPVFYSKNVQTDLKALKGLVKGEFIEAQSWNSTDGDDPRVSKINYPGLQHPLICVTSRLLWNPDEDLGAMLEEYYTLFYGNARGPMKAFWEEAEKAWMSRDPKMGDSPSAVYSKDTVSRMIQLLAEAKKLTSTDSVYYRRIDLIEKEFKPAADKTVRLSGMVQSTVSVPAISSVRVDGVLDKSEWRDSSLLRLIDSNFQIGAPATHVRLGWSPEAFKIAVICFEPDMKQLKAAVTSAKQDASSHIWNDDSIEIFLMPDGLEKRKVFQFIINPNGVLYDSLNITDYFSGGDSNWESRASVAVKRLAKSWVIEMSIPWESLDISSPKAGVSIRSNIYRNRMTSGKLEPFSWAPMINAAYFSPNDFGKMILSQWKDDNEKAR